MALSLYFMAMAILSLLQHLVLPVLLVCAFVWPLLVFLEVRDWRAARAGRPVVAPAKPRQAAPREAQSTRPTRPHLRHRWV